jgi:hypothetical protein
MHRRVSTIINDPIDAEILSRERWTIELLARETRTAVAKVQQVFLIEYKKLALHAHVKSYLSLLASSSVRVILGAQKAEKAATGGIDDPQRVRNRTD